MEMTKEMMVEEDLVVEGEIRREAMFVEVGKRNGLIECGVTYPGGAEQSCLILCSPHTGERNPETLTKCVESEAQNVNKDGDLLAVYIDLVAEKVYFFAHKDRSPVLLLMGGGMGAVKSTVLKEILKEPFWAGADAVLIEADAFKESDVIYRALSSRGHADMINTAEFLQHGQL
ncbi:hypothetical protein Bca101_026007 [Brassica carinata]